MMKDKILKYAGIINEALPFEVAKDFSDLNYKKRLNNWFDGKKRIYLPVPIENNSLKTKIETLLKDKNFINIDYKKNSATTNTENKQTLKISRILAKTETQEIVQKYINDIQNTNEEKLVVISRHPNDIAGMSTDRKWTSCKRIGVQNPIHKKKFSDIDNENGANASYLKTETSRMLIAYLIDANDKNIKDPIARLLLVPYYNDSKEFFVVADNMYKYESDGNFYPEFRKILENWLNEKQKDSEPGVYRFDTKNIYLDNQKKVIYNKVLNDKLPDWVIESGNKPEEYYYNQDDDFFWKNGTWKDGTWKDGTWENGIWRRGIWKNGIWIDGTWEDGTWERGFIYDPDRKGNYEKDWKWEDGYVESKLDPKTYFAKKGKKNDER